MTGLGYIARDEGVERDKDVCTPYKLFDGNNGFFTNTSVKVLAYRKMNCLSRYLVDTFYCAIVIP